MMNPTMTAIQNASVAGSSSDSLARARRRRGDEQLQGSGPQAVFLEDEEREVEMGRGDGAGALDPDRARVRRLAASVIRPRRPPRPAIVRAEVQQIVLNLEAEAELPSRGVGRVHPLRAAAAGQPAQGE